MKNQGGVLDKRISYLFWLERPEQYNKKNAHVDGI
jgi:hypothetical protein